MQFTISARRCCLMKKSIHHQRRHVQHLSRQPATQTLYACLQGFVEKPKTAKWVLLLSEFDIKYVTQKSMKGRAIADHLAHCSLEEAEEIQ